MHPGAPTPGKKALPLADLGYEDLESKGSRLSCEGLKNPTLKKCSNVDLRLINPCLAIWGVKSGLFPHRTPEKNTPMNKEVLINIMISTFPANPRPACAEPQCAPTRQVTSLDKPSETPLQPRAKPFAINHTQQHSQRMSQSTNARASNPSHQSARIR